MTNANKNKGSGGERELVKYLIKVLIREKTHNIIR